MAIFTSEDFLLLEKHPSSIACCKIYVLPMFNHVDNLVNTIRITGEQSEKEINLKSQIMAKMSSWEGKILKVTSCEDYSSRTEALLAFHNKTVITLATYESMF